MTSLMSVILPSERFRAVPAVRPDFQTVKTQDQLRYSLGIDAGIESRAADKATDGTKNKAIT
jgi:hypothetical protein